MKKISERRFRKLAKGNGVYNSEFKMDLNTFKSYREMLMPNGDVVLLVYNHEHTNSSIIKEKYFMLKKNKYPKKCAK